MEKTEKLTGQKKGFTLENSTEFSLKLDLGDDEDDAVIIQEIMEIATNHALRSYSNFIFTHPNKKHLWDFLNELRSKDLNYQYEISPPKINL